MQAQQRLVHRVELPTLVGFRVYDTEHFSAMTRGTQGVDELVKHHVPEELLFFFIEFAEVCSLLRPQVIDDDSTPNHFVVIYNIFGAAKCFSETGNPL